MRRLSADEGRVSVVTPDGCGCLESSIVGCLFCCHCCSSERLGSQMAFFPPRPPSYALQRDVRGKIHARYTDGGSQITAGGRLAAFDAHFVPTKRNTEIVVLAMDAPTKNASVDGDPKKHAITLIVSHGNALDAAMFVPFGRRLRDTLGVNIVLYDYSGYGVSTGRASVRNVYADLEAVVDWCVASRHADPKRIVLYGQSIGSAPTCRYAAKAGEAHDASLQMPAHLKVAHPRVRANATNEKNNKSNKVAPSAPSASSEHATEMCLDAMTAMTPNACFVSNTSAHHQIGGVVLVSPIMSGLNVISGESPGCCAPASVFAACDVFPNHERAAKIRCPTLVVHGTRDVQVPFRHGVVIHEALSSFGCDDGDDIKGGDDARKETSNEKNASEEKTNAKQNKRARARAKITHPEPYWVAGAGHDDVYERDPNAFLDRMRGFLESVNRAASLRETMRGDDFANFNAVRDSAERAREAARFNETRDGAEAERAFFLSSQSLGRDGGAPVRVMEMTRDG